MMPVTLMTPAAMATLSEIRDGFQQRLLTCLYRGSESSSLVLKGGAAMRVLTASARYTQDLDFDHDPRRSLASLQKTVRSAIGRALQGSGLTQLSISEPKQTDTVARWKISCRTAAGDDLHLTVEVLRRGAPDLSHVVKIPVQLADRTLPRVYVSVYDEQALADSKLAALIDERRTAPRDIFDLEVLLARGACPGKNAVERAGGRAALLQRVSSKLDLMDWPLFRDHVLPALSPENQAHVDEDEYLAMKGACSNRSSVASPTAAMRGPGRDITRVEDVSRACAGGAGRPSRSRPQVDPGTGASRATRDFRPNSGTMDPGRGRGESVAAGRAGPVPERADQPAGTARRGGGVAAPGRGDFPANGPR